MRVLHVTASYYPAIVYGGSIFATHGLCKFLVREGIHVTVLTTNANGDSVLDYPPGIPVDKDDVKIYYYKRSMPIRHVISFSLRKAIWESIDSFDIVHIHSSFCVHSIWAAKFAREKKIPFIISPHGSLNQEYMERKSQWKKKVWLDLIERKHLEKADAVCFSTNHEQVNALKLNINFQRSVIIPHGIDPEEWRERETNGSGIVLPESLVGRPFILFVGRLSWEKGIQHLIASFGKVKDKFPDLQLAIAGPDTDGYTSLMEICSRDSGVFDRVRFLGLLGRKALSSLLEKCAFLVLPSTSENFGMTAAEAMYFSRPVLLTPGVGIADDVACANAGVVVEQDSEGIAKGICFILNDPERAEAMGISGRKLVEDKFYWPTIAKKMVGVYEEVIASRRMK